jgi:hypothetical protein
VRTVGTQIFIPNRDPKKREPALEYTAMSAVEALKAVRTAGIVPHTRKIRSQAWGDRADDGHPAATNLNILDKLSS